MFTLNHYTANLTPLMAESLLSLDDVGERLAILGRVHRALVSDIAIDHLYPKVPDKGNRG